MTDVLDAIEFETAPQPTSSVIWLHGLGADGTDFLPVVHALELPPVPIRFVFPHAPKQPVTINGGYVMRAWYDIVNDDLSRREDEPGVRASQRLVEALIEREVARGTAEARIVLAGFSQGGAIALQTGLRYPQRLAGIIALSTYVPIAHTLFAERSETNRDVPIFMAHGLQDPVVAIGHSRSSRQLLAALGYKVEAHEYPIPHTVSSEELVDIGVWFRSVLG